MNRKSCKKKYGISRSFIIGGSLLSLTLIISFALLNENHDAALGIASAVFASFSIAFVLTERRYLLGNIFMST